MKIQAHTPLSTVRFLLLLFLMLSGTGFSQTDDFCATPPKTVADPPGVYSKSTDPSILGAFQPKVFNIFYWGINKSDGSYTQPGWPITLERAKASVALLNEQYAPLNICFNLKGMDTINSTAHHTGSYLGAIKFYAQNNGYYDSNAFNIYVPHKLMYASGQSGYNQTNVAIIATAIDQGRTLAHEIGHCFNLIHTFDNSSKRPDPVNCEHVTRDPNNPDNWYAPDGTLIYMGTALTISPEITQQYKLEIISDLDGFKDYDQVTVTVNPYRILSMAPNPVSSLLTIEYKAEGANSAYVMVLNQSTGASDNYILQTTENEIVLDLSNLNTGLNSVVLVCNGEIQDTKNLLKQ